VGARTNIRRRVRDVLASRTALDWLPVVVLPVVLEIDAALSVRGRPITIVSVLAAIVGCLPLVARRRVSFPVLLAPLVGGVVLVLWRVHPENTVVLIPMVALFECALRGDRRQSIWMAVAIGPCVFISVIPFATGAAHVAGIVVRNLLLCLLAIVAGEMVRSRRQSAERMVAAAEQATLRRLSDERLRIAREIHDVVAHAMTAINVQAGVAAHLLQRDPGQAQSALRDIKRTSGEALAELRGTLEVLRDPAQGAPMGPVASLHDLAPLVENLRAAGVDVRLDVEPVAELPAAVDGAGYRIVQEALTNVARHAAASSAEVSIRRAGDDLCIDIVDDGRGNVQAVPGNGLRGMRERAVALGGTLEAAPGADHGWRVSARLPLGTAAV